MKRVTLRVELLDGRVVPRAVSGDAMTIHRGGYLVSNPPEDDEVVTVAPLGSKQGVAVGSNSIGDPTKGFEPLGTGYKPGTTGG
jgi:hypothetical protein